MTQEEAKAKFDDVTEFEPPFMNDNSEAVRFVDGEAGMVFWGFFNEGHHVSKTQLEVEMKPIIDTELE